MKRHFFKFLMVALPATVLFSCSPATDKTTDTDSDTLVETTITEPVTTIPTDAKTVVITQDAVPTAVQTSFKEKNPKAENAEWMTYEPVEYDNITVTSPADTIYYVKYMNNGAEHYNWYNANGTWIKSSTEFVGGSDKLPAAVNKTIAEQYPGYTISEIDKENDKDMDMYEVELDKGESKAKLKILPDGTIFKKKEK